MTNPGNAIGTNAAYGGRTSVNAFNDLLAAFPGPGILGGWRCVPKAGLTVSLGGDGVTRDVAIAEDNIGNKTTVNNISEQPVDLTLNAAPGFAQRIDAIVAYVNNPPEGTATTADNPEACGIIVVSGTEAADSPAAPTEAQIRAAIGADGGISTTAYYVVLAQVNLTEGMTDITATNIVSGREVGVVAVDAALSTTSINPVENRVVTQAINQINTQINGADANLTRLVSGTGVTLTTGRKA